MKTDLFGNDAICETIIIGQISKVERVSFVYLHRLSKWEATDVGVGLDVLLVPLGKNQITTGV